METGTGISCTLGAAVFLVAGIAVWNRRLIFRFVLGLLDGPAIAWKNGNKKEALMWPLLGSVRKIKHVAHTVSVAHMRGERRTLTNSESVWFWEEW